MESMRKLIKNGENGFPKECLLHYERDKKKWLIDNLTKKFEFSGDKIILLEYIVNTANFIEFKTLYEGGDWFLSNEASREIDHYLHRKSDLMYTRLALGITTAALIVNILLSAL